MIAACPKCSARYRIERAKLRPEGVRLRCAKCEAVFKVRPPERASAEEGDAGAPAARSAGAPPGAAPAAAGPPAATSAASPAAARAPTPAEQAPAPAASPPPAAPAPDGPLVLVAVPDDDLAKRTGELLLASGLRVARVADGVEAMLEIQRRLPAAVLLSAQLPRMYGFQVCEVVKRNESLQHIAVVLAGAIHHKDRYRRPPNELYGADAYVEEPDLPEGLLPVLERAGIGPARGAPDARPAAAPASGPEPAAQPPPEPAAAPEAAAPAQGPAADDGLADERAKAERLARIIVSDIVLYNEEKFAAAIRDGSVVARMEPDLAEGRGLFQERIDERVRAEKDHLVEELLRVARSRGMA